MPPEDRESERRQATVLFADISGFTAMSEKMDPEDVTDVMNGCFTMMEAIVRGHGGVIDKYIGDCVMALFGVPNAIENAPRQAVQASLEMRSGLEQFNREHDLPVPLQVHIGVNSGLVIAGNVGGGTKRDFTVMGDTVNLASRLEDASEKGQVFVGPETYRYTREDFEYRPVGPLKLKGKAEPIPAFEAVSLKKRAEETQPEDGERRIFSEIVGREGELRQLHDCLQTVLRESGRITTVMAEAGIGKSRLLTEMMAFPEVQGFTLLRGRGLSMGRALSFHPFIELLRQWAEIGEGDSDKAALDKLDAAITRIAPIDTTEITPFVATMMGVRLSRDYRERVAGLDAEAMEGLIVKNLRLLFEKIAATQPLLLLFEDFHWADASSVRLLTDLFSLVHENQLLFLIACRPDFPASRRILDLATQQYEAQHLALRLRRLDDRDCAALVRNLLRIDNLPRATRALIVEKAEGNPFYVEEVVRSLIDRGAIEVEGGRRRLAREIESVDLPGSIQDVIMARVDRLDATTRRVLQVASVIGRSFDHRVIAEVMADDPELDNQLALLKERELLLELTSRQSGAVRRREVPEETQISFSHALVQETIYKSILQRTARELHLRVARSVESIFADRLDDFFGVLAYHYSHAENLEKAEEYLFKAGAEAARAAASAEALHYFRQASDLYLRIHGDGGDPKQKALLEQNIAFALMNTGKLSESVRHFDRALEHLGDRVQRGRLGSKLSAGRDVASVLTHLIAPRRLRRSTEGQALYRDALQIRFQQIKALSTSDPKRLAPDYFAAMRRVIRTDPATIPDEAPGFYGGFAALFAYSGISFRIGRRYLDMAKAVLRPDNVKDLFDYRVVLFIHDFLEGRWSSDEAIEPHLIEQGLRSGELWEVNTVLGLDCDRLLRRGDFAAAHAHLARLADIADDYGFEFARANHDGMSAILLLEERRLDEALQAVDVYYADRDEDMLRILALGTKAKAQLLAGDRQGASASLDEAERTLQRSPIVPAWHLSAYATARLLCDVDALEGSLAAGDRRRAQQQASKARQSAHSALRVAAKVAVQRVEIHRLAARLYWLLGKQRKARVLWRRAVEEGERLGAKPELARTYAEAGELLLARGRPALGDIDAGQYLERGRALLAEIGLAWDLARIEEARRAA